MNHIAAVLCEDSHVATSVSAKAHELGSVWSHTFSKLGKVPAVASKFLEAQGTKWHMAHVSPPGHMEFVNFIKALKDSAPGPDGIPYSCYKALIDTSAKVFFLANLILLQGRLLGEHSNAQRGCIIPKNSPSEGCDPRADELRTLGLKNTDNKAITLLGLTVPNLKR